MNLLVEASDGTGLVHAAPAFGEMDFFRLCQGMMASKLSVPLDQNGKFH